MISIDIQKSVVTEAAERRGRYIAEWIEDPDQSGRHFKRKIMKGIERVEADDNPLSEIWVWKFSRFGRNRHGVAINLARIENVGGQLISATEDVDAKTAVGRFTRGMLLEVAAFESDRAGEQWKETHELRRSMGLPATGGKRFGYTWFPRRIPDGKGGWTLQDERYEVHPDPAELSLEGIQRYNAGKTGYGKIAIRWNDLGMFNTRGRPWQDQAVRWYFDSGFGAGLLVTHRPDVQCGDPGRCQKPPHYDHRPAEHEGIWSGDEWDEYHERRAARKSTPRRSLTPAYPLSGLIRCGVCQSFPINDNSRCPCYAYNCGALTRHAVSHEIVWIRRSVVEGEVFGWLLTVRDEIDDIATGRVVIPQPHKAPDATKARKRLEKEIAKLTGALDRAAEGFTLGDIPRDSYLRTRDKFAGQRAERQKELDALPDDDAPQLSPLPYRETVQGLLDEWDTISVPSKRVMLASIVRRVEIAPNKSVFVVPVWAPADDPHGTGSAKSV
jgi:DNA invertase Pin-like site-specific DNA recombinase